MKKDFHSMLQREVGESPISHPWIDGFLKAKGFGRSQIKIILQRYFSPSINHYKLKPYDNE